MKQFSAQTGGRYTFVDDLINLQDLALSIVSIFDNCDNFIVSGCEISGDTVSPGYVYINKKIRWFNGATGVEFPCYIYEQNMAETMTYANGQDKVGRHIYGCALAASVPSSNDPLTNAAPQYIQLTERGGLRLNEAFFGSNCLLLSASDTQIVRSDVLFAANVSIDGSLNLGSLTIVNGSSTGRLYHDSNGRFVLSNKKGSGATYGMSIVHDTGFVFAADGSNILKVHSSQVTATVPFTAPRVSTSNVAIASDNIYEHATNADNGCLKINMLGYNGGSGKYRDTMIGDGKGTAIVFVDGSDATVQINGTVASVSSAKEALVLKSTYPSSDEENFLKTLVIKDSNAVVAAIFGYNSATDTLQSSAVGNLLSIINNIGSINIVGTGYVNIGPVIQENGVALSTKYVLRSDLPSWVFGNAPSSGLTQEMADARYALKTGGLSQFIIAPNTASVLRGQIGALGQTEGDLRYAKLGSYLSDMARTEAEKALIRQNIGAAASSIQYTIYDSGWIMTKGDMLYSRQWGKVVSIQGKVYTNYANQILFAIPNGIGVPAYDVEVICSDDLGSSSNYNFRVKIAAGQRNAVVTYMAPGMYNTLVVFTLTYMVA